MRSYPSSLRHAIASLNWQSLPLNLWVQQLFSMDYVPLTSLMFFYLALQLCLSVVTDSLQRMLANFVYFKICVTERGKLADPFYRLEHQEEDLKKKKQAEPVLVRLQRMSDARHSDDYALNKSLRAKLRVCYLAHII